MRDSVDRIARPLTASSTTIHMALLDPQVTGTKRCLNVPEIDRLP